MDTLRSIFDGMRCDYSYDSLRYGSTWWEHDPAKCPKCRIEVLLAEYEKVDPIQRMRKLGGVFNEFADELVQWLAVNLDRIRAQTRLEGEISEHKRTCQMYWHVGRGKDLRCSEGYACERLAALEAQAKEKP